MNSLFQAEGAYPQNYMADQQRLQISELQFDKFTHTCMVSPSEAMLRIKEVEMVDSFDDLKSSHSIQGYINFPEF